MAYIQVPHIKGIVMNANGCQSKKLKVGQKKIRSKRKDIRQQVIWDHNPDIIFIQESDIVLRNICTWNFRYRYYQSIGGQEAGIIFDALTFTLCTKENPMIRFRKIYEYRKFKLKEDLSSATLLDRMQAVILQTKGPFVRKFLFVSWHGPHKLKRNLKTKMLKDLMFLIYLYLKDKNIPVVIGGDFNLDLSKTNLFQRSFPLVFDPYVNPNAQFVLCDYLKLDHRHKKIDYVITSRTLTNVSCKPIDVWEYLFEKYPGLPLAYYTAVLDHDSLIVQFLPFYMTAKTLRSYNAITSLSSSSSLYSLSSSSSWSSRRRSRPRRPRLSSRRRSRPRRPRLSSSSSSSSSSWSSSSSPRPHSRRRRPKTQTITFV